MQERRTAPAGALATAPSMPVVVVVLAVVVLVVVLDVAIATAMLPIALTVAGSSCTCDDAGNSASCARCRLVRRHLCVLHIRRGRAVDRAAVLCVVRQGLRICQTHLQMQQWAARIVVCMCGDAGVGGAEGGGGTFRKCCLNCSFPDSVRWKHAMTV
jgi:hypothetical protein